MGRGVTCSLKYMALPFFVVCLFLSSEYSVPSYINKGTLCLSASLFPSLQGTIPPLNIPPPLQDVVLFQG